MARPTIHILEFNRMVYDLRNLHGRDLVIVGASLIELGLEISLARLWGISSNTQHGELFSGNSAVASTFAAKITLARLEGLISKRTADEITFVRRLRNLFAHSYTVHSLLDPACSDLIGQFGYMTQTDLRHGGALTGYETVDVRRPGVTISPFGYPIAVDDLELVRDRVGKVGFFVPTMTEQVDAEARTRQQIWMCITAAVMAKLTDWINDPALTHVPFDPNPEPA